MMKCCFVANSWLHLPIKNSVNSFATVRLTALLSTHSGDRSYENKIFEKITALAPPFLKVYYALVECEGKV